MESWDQIGKDLTGLSTVKGQDLLFGSPRRTETRTSLEYRAPKKVLPVKEDHGRSGVRRKL